MVRTHYPRLGYQIYSYLIKAKIAMLKCLENGLSFKTIDGNILTLRPALVISHE